MAYNSLPPRVDIFARLLREALWAPLAIVLASIVLGRVLAAEELWWLVHILGGAALAFCYLRAIGIADGALGRLRGAGRYLLAFSATCSTALAWEIVEFV